MNSTPNPLRLAVMGLRHGHINSLLSAVQLRDDVVLVGACEEDEATRSNLSESQLALLSGCPLFGSFQEMSQGPEYDAVAVGDYFGKRGSIVIEALRLGKHIISDKPICTHLAELDEIDGLVAASDLKLGCMLDVRDSGTFRRLRRMVTDGEIGEVRAISFGGQHPLLPATRPGWYFEAGKQGGTINDIAVHALDFIPWITGHNFETLNAARAWNTSPGSHPFLDDAAQLMLTLEGGCGVLGDVSYLAPDSFGYTMPHYWRTTLWGSTGVAEASATRPEVTVYLNGETEGRQLPPDEARPSGYLEDFLAEVRGTAASQVPENLGSGPAGTTDALNTAGILRVSRVSLTVQSAAENGATNVPLNF